VQEGEQETTEGSPSGLPRLPPGRHGLPREFVVQNQRDRLAAGIIAAVTDKGYHESTISQIAAAAGVSRRTFYAYFSSKEEAFITTYDQIVDHMRQAGAEAAAANRGEWPEKVTARFAASLETFAANPQLARFTLAVPPRAGDTIAAHYRATLNLVLTEIVAGMPSDIEAPSPAVQHALIGGVASLIVNKLDAGEGERMPELLPDLVELFLAPYIGRAEAVRQAAKVSTGAS
jgi:AcrR family transcriptional regulator